LLQETVDELESQMDINAQLLFEFARVTPEDLDNLEGLYYAKRRRTFYRDELYQMGAWMGSKIDA
jgi:hypothetical protein